MKKMLWIFLFIPILAVYAGECAPDNKYKYINEKQILRSATNLHPAALKKAIENYKWVRNNHAIDNPDILTIIDFNLPSNEKRLWVINLKNSQVLFNTFTTHGKNSGLVYAKDFSNTVGTVKSSLGAFKTLSTYQGKHGISLKIQGLENGVNNNAYRRTIVFHPAHYASAQYIKANNRAGRSWGCFAIDPAISKKLINTIKNGSIIYAHHALNQLSYNAKHV